MVLKNQKYIDELDEPMDLNEVLLLATAAGSYITKSASYKAFEKKYSSFTAVDLIDEITSSFMEYHNAKF